MSTIPASRFDELIEQFSGLRLLVVGDVMLDEFVWGKVSRISPEAPVPVVEVQSASFYPGGAANVLRNLACFTPHTTAVGAVGRDTYGAQLKELLRAEGTSVDGVIEIEGRVTGHKMRIIGRQQQIVRVDRETVGPIDAASRDKLIDFLRREIPKHDAVILEDYGKGLLDQVLVDAAIAEARAHKKILTVDLNPRNPLNWNGATAVKPNRPEALACAGLNDGDDPQIIDQAAAILQQRWQTDYLLITVGEDGMYLFKEGKARYHTPTRAQKVFDVSGAGDTAISIFTLALAAGASGIEAAELSNHASGVVVGKLGTATLTPDELRASFRPIPAA